MLEILGYSSGILMMVSSVPYIRDIVKGKTKPERATWFIWSVVMMIAFFAQVASGGTFSTLLTVGDTIVVIVIFILSIKHGMAGWMMRDKMALVGAGISLILWYFTKNPAIALFIVIFIDFLGGWLTIVKSYENPESETMLTWFFSSIAGFLGILAVGEMNFVLLAFPIYVCLMNLTIGLVIFFGRKKLQFPS